MGRVTILFLALAIVVPAVTSGLPAEVFDPTDIQEPWDVVDVAIVLDTSSSMESLIGAAQLKLWEIVSELALMEPTPTLRVGLVTYGNPEYGYNTGWVRVETDFTEDLNEVSEKLFALTCEGGSEYLGRALEAAVDGISWSPSSETLKLLFVAGNESANQDSTVIPEQVMERAKGKGIYVQTLYWGSLEDDAAESWRLMAERAEVGFAAVDSRSSGAMVETAVDKEMALLGQALNETYIPLGDKGEERKREQARLDKKAADLSPAAAAGRAQAKSTPLYSTQWDLVSAVESGRLDLYEMDETQLPESLQQMSAGELAAIVEEARLQRESLQVRIAQLSAERQRLVEEHLVSQGLDTSQSFDGTVLEVIRVRAQEKGFEVSDH